MPFSWPCPNRSVSSWVLVSANRQPSHNQQLLWTGPRRVCMIFYSLARPARRVAGHRASSVMPHTADRPGGRRPMLPRPAHPPSARRRCSPFAPRTGFAGRRRQTTQLAFAPVGPFAPSGPAGGVVWGITSRCCGRVRTRPRLLVHLRLSARALPATERQSLCVASPRIFRRLSSWQRSPLGRSGRLLRPSPGGPRTRHR